MLKASISEVATGVVPAKKSVLKNFAIFTGKNLCQSLFLIKLQAQAWNLLIKETLAQVFPCEFCEVFKNTFFTEHLRMTASGTLTY